MKKILYLLLFLPHLALSQIHQDTLQARVYSDKALAYLYEGKTDSSLHYYELAKPIYRQYANYRMLLECEANMAYNFYYKAQYQMLITHTKEALNYLEIKIQNKDADFAALYTYLGLTFFTIKDLSQAHYYYRKSLIYQNKRDEALLDVYQALYQVSLMRRDDIQAANYQIEILKLKKELKQTYEEIAYSYIALGRSYLETYPNLSKLYFDTVHVSYLPHIENKVSYDKITALLYNNYTSLFDYLGEYDSMFYYLNQEKEIFQKSLKTTYYSHYARYYIEKRQYGQALYFLRKAEESILTENHFNQKKPYGSLYRKFSLLYLRQGKYKLAAQYAQRSISKLLVDFSDTTLVTNPTLKTTNNERIVASSLNLKARAFAKWGIATHDEEKLKFGLETYRLLMKLFDKMAALHETQGSKALIAQDSWYMLESAIDHAHQASTTFSNPTYAKEAFFFAEKSKSIVVKDAMADMAAKSTAQLPKEIMEQERALKLEVTAMERQLLEAKKSKKEEAISKARTGLFHAQDSLLKFTRNLEQDYPRYHQLKYQNEQLSVEEVQERLKADQAMVEYFVGDSNVYVFTITKELYHVKQLPKDESLEQYAKLFRKSLDRKRLQTDSDQTFADFNKAAYQLYATFLAPAVQQLPNGIQQLIIVPDGPLSYVPFELLIQSPAASEIPDYRALEFLIRKFRVNYAYSAQLYFMEMARPEGEIKGDLLAFAPSYKDAQTDSSQLALAGRFRDQLVELRWNKEEVNKIGEYLSGNLLLREEATEGKFKELASQYRIIHLAMHALVDDQEPLYSRLAFTNTPSEEEDDFLNVFELYNMELNADLAVLSACNTGFGKLVRGEGIMSLARGFAYAGCPSVVMSHWQVDDQTTAQLMETFYQGLADGMTKSAALQQAQLRYLENAGPREAHPMFWGSFVLIGKDDPIKTTSWSMWYFVAFAGLMMAVAWWLKRKKA